LAGPFFEGSFEFVEHTADIAARLRACTPAGVFEVAAAAMTEAVTDRGTVLPATERAVDLVAAELDLLLVDWLEELLFLFETEGFLVHDAHVQITERTREYVIHGTVRGERRDSARHPLKLLIKAVTYHGLHIVETADGCEATVIFDI